MMYVQYRREIDGLRALAVVPVILFHAGFELFSGGFVGVDVFFVISGYLITSIILAELHQQKFSLLNFYERRIRRILPALFLVIFVSIPFSWLLLPPAELTSFSKSLIAVLLFASNVFFWLDGGYFETTSELKPLLHTWSLAVEEQYYLIFPVFLLSLWSRARRWILPSVVVVFSLSLFLAQWASYREPMAAFFLLPTRAWEILLGAFVAFYAFSEKRKSFGDITCELGSFLGIILIFYSVLNYTEETPFPGIFALIPTLGAVLIILFASSQTTVGRFLGNKLCVGIGLISYSAYLWHQPVFAFAKFLIPETTIFWKLILLILVTLLAYLSWRFLESPFRDRNKVGPRLVLSLSFFSIGIVFLIGAISSSVDFGREELMAKELARNQAVFSSNMNERSFIKYRIKHESLKPEALVIGSSRLMQVGSEVTNKSVLNLSVSGASIEDLVAIWGMASPKFNSRYVFLGADPWIFNSNSEQTRWTTLRSEYNSSMLDLGLTSELQNLNKGEPALISKIAIDFYNRVNHSDVEATDDVPSVFDKIRRDGSRVYNLSYANKTSDDVARNAKSDFFYGMSNFRYADDVRITLERLVLTVARSDRQVVLILSPYHPALYERMTYGDRQFLKIENRFRKLAKDLGVQVIGSYDPHDVGCTSVEFFDGMHPKDSCMKKVFAKLQ